MTEYEIPDDWVMEFIGRPNKKGMNSLAAQKRGEVLRANFPRAIWVDHFFFHARMTSEDKILKAKYERVIENLITEKKPKAQQQPRSSDWTPNLFYEFIMGHLDEIKERVPGIKLPPPPPEDDSDDGFGGGGGTIRKNKHRTSRKIRKSRTNRKNLRKSMRKGMKRRKNTMRRRNTNRKVRRNTMKRRNTMRRRNTMGGATGEGSVPTPAPPRTLAEELEIARAQAKKLRDEANQQRAAGQQQRAAAARRYKVPVGAALPAPAPAQARTLEEQYQIASSNSQAAAWGY